MVKDGDILRCRTNLKPLLKAHHVSARMAFISTFVDTWGTYSPMYDRVHIDEKWFFLHHDAECSYLVADEDRPYQPVQHKSHVQKIMILAAVARPRMLSDGTFFDGKIGLWPFAKWVPAKRTLKNRVRGTMELKPVSANKARVRSMLLDFVLPAIDRKWPELDGNTHVVIQQDNASPHVAPNDPDFVAARVGKRLAITLSYQPA